MILIKQLFTLATRSTRKDTAASCSQHRRRLLDERSRCSLSLAANVVEVETLQPGPEGRGGDDPGQDLERHVQLRGHVPDDEPDERRAQGPRGEPGPVLRRRPWRREPEVAGRQHEEEVVEVHRGGVGHRVAGEKGVADEDRHAGDDGGHKKCVEARAVLPRLTSPRW